jgi:hypothetical protein
MFCTELDLSGFDFEGNPEQNPPITSQNIKSRANLFASIVKVRYSIFISQRICSKEQATSDTTTFFSRLATTSGFKMPR